MFRKLEVYISEVIRGKRQGIFPFFIKGFLYILSFFFRFGVALRNWAYDKGWIRKHSPSVPVISIGNIVAGGTGKTPVTLAMAQQFADEFTVAILSRGYRSEAEKMGHPTILSKGAGPIYPSSYCGDEPYLLAQNVSKAWVIVGHNRLQASHIAARAGAQLIILDDGMQHRSLSRDYEVVVMDAHDPFGKGYFLPRGFLREDISALCRADLIVLNHVKDHDHYLSISHQIQRHSKAPVVGTKMAVHQILKLDGNKIESINNKRVGLFCGIANPDSFRATLQDLGAAIVEDYSISDHGHFELAGLRRFAEKAAKKGAEWLVCTEKDRVRLDQALVADLPIAWLKVRLEVVAGLPAWYAFLANAKQDVMTRIPKAS